MADGRELKTDCEVDREAEAVPDADAVMAEMVWTTWLRLASCDDHRRRTGYVYSPFVIAGSAVYHLTSQKKVWLPGSQLLVQLAGGVDCWMSTSNGPLRDEPS